MKLTETIKVTPENVPRSIRTIDQPFAGSGDAGYCHPIGAHMLFREDSVTRGQFTASVEMQETAETLMNGVKVKMMVHLVPFCALPRFEGSMELFNASYKGVPGAGGQSVEFFNISSGNLETQRWYHKMGIPMPGTPGGNLAYLEAFNFLWNWRQDARFKGGTPRDEFDRSHAPAFWPQGGRMSNVVPSFDQAVMDGEVELNLIGELPVRGLASSTNSPNAGGSGFNWSGDGNLGTGYYAGDGRTAVATDANGQPQVFAQLQDMGVKLSLQNIELAKQTAAFAQLRKQYETLDDDHIIDMLMDGIRVPDVALMQPILLAQSTTVLGYDKRFATDGANLKKSVSQGIGDVTLTYRTPPVNTGGVIICTMEIVPEQMFERIEDPFCNIQTPEQMPSFVRDYLDPQKVDTMTNKQVDYTHVDPDGTFGFEPLNNRFRSITQPRIGGKFFLTNTSKGSENRMRIWSPERVDPTLSEDFYLVGQLPKSVFADTLMDGFEWTGWHRCQVSGHTVFGKQLQEDGDEYETIDGMIDKSRIESPEQ